MFLNCFGENQQNNPKKFTHFVMIDAYDVTYREKNTIQKVKDR